MNHFCEDMEILLKSNQVIVYAFGYSRQSAVKFTIKDVNLDIESPYIIQVVGKRLKKALDSNAGKVLKIYFEDGGKRIKLLKTDITLRTTNKIEIESFGIKKELEGDDFDVNDLELSSSFITNQICLDDALYQLGYFSDQIEIISDKKQGIILREFGQLGNTKVIIPLKELKDYTMDFEGERIKSKYSFIYLKNFCSKNTQPNLFGKKEPYCRVKFGENDILGLKVEYEELNASLEAIIHPIDVE
jgi:hypothetical protein